MALPSRSIPGIGTAVQALLCGVSGGPTVLDMSSHLLVLHHDSVARGDLLPTGRCAIRAASLDVSTVDLGTEWTYNFDDLRLDAAHVLNVSPALLTNTKSPTSYFVLCSIAQFPPGMSVSTFSSGIALRWP